MKLDAPRLMLTQEKVEGGKIVLDAKLERGEEQAHRKNHASEASRARTTALNAGPLEADIDVQGDGRTVKARLDGACRRSRAKRFELPNLTLPQGQ